MLCQSCLAGIVTTVHAADLRHGDVTFIDDQQGIVRQIFKQCRWRRSGRAARQITGIVFNSGTGTGCLHHLDIKPGTLFQTLRFQQAAIGFKIGQPFLQFDLNLRDGLIHGRARRHIVTAGIDHDLFQISDAFPGQRVKFLNRLDFVAEQINPPGPVFKMSRENLNHIPPDAECVPMEICIIALVLQRHEFLQDIRPVD